MSSEQIITGLLLLCIITIIVLVLFIIITSFAARNQAKSSSEKRNINALIILASLIVVLSLLRLFLNQPILHILFGSLIVYYAYNKNITHRGFVISNKILGVMIFVYAVIYLVFSSVYTLSISYGKITEVFQS